jgi:outer membrane protein assembly factor BamB
MKNGVVYHTTNCGIIAAIDALSGEERWLMRYPVVSAIHDATVPADKAGLGVLWNNRPPLIYGRRMYVTPVDSNRLYCLDIDTGRVIWSRGKGHTDALSGMTRRGELILTGHHFSLVKPETGQETWKFYLPAAEGTRNRRPEIQGRPLFTTDGKAYFAGGFAGGLGGWGNYMRTQSAVDMEKRKDNILAERRYYDPFRYLKERPDVKNTEAPFLHTNRMTCTRFGTQFELEFSGRTLSVAYDTGKVLSAAKKSGGIRGLMALAELTEMDGNWNEAISLLEKARGKLPVEREDLRFAINRGLFRLYLKMAQRSLQVGDREGVEKYCFMMPTACTSSFDEIKTILSVAEVFEKKGDLAKAARCLESLGKHYGAVKFSVPSIVLDDQTALKRKAADIFTDLLGRVPTRYYKRELTIAGSCMKKSVNNYFSMISPLEPDLRVDTRSYASRRMVDLLGKLPESYRRAYEDRSREAFTGREKKEELTGLIKEFPGTSAAQTAFDGMMKKALALEGTERQIEMWRLNDLGRNNGLKVPPELEGQCNIAVPSTRPAGMSPAYTAKKHQFKYDAKTLLVMLQRTGDRKGGEGLFFIGARAKRMHANKFRLICWRAKENKRLWETPELRLKGKGKETGFEEYLISGGRVVTHGRFDVLAFSLEDGKELWRLRVPHGFEIVHACGTGNIMILSSMDKTIAVHLSNGQIFWESNEIGAPYARPFLRDNVVISVRKNPSGATFRRLGTGQLLTHLELSPLNVSGDHPVLPDGNGDLPISYNGKYLAVTDGWDYILVDTDLMRVRWQKRIGEVDRSRGQLPYRIWLSDRHLMALKKSYDTVHNEVVDLDTGRLLWKHAAEKNEGTVYSVLFDGANAYGLQYEPKQRCVHLMGFDQKSGKKTLDWIERGYSSPRVFLDKELRGGCAVVVLADKQKYKIEIYDTKTKKKVFDFDEKGFGLFGAYGQVSYAIQGPDVALLSGNKLTVAVPKK